MRAYLYSILFLLSGLVVQAQEYDPVFGGDRKFAGGIVAGANFTQVDGDTYFGYHKLGLNAGGIVYVNFSPRFGMSTEILFTQKGARGIDELNSPYAGPYFGKYNMRLNYAEVPVIFHYYITPKYHFGLGASYCRLVSSSEYYDGIDRYTFDSDQYPFKKNQVELIINASMVIWRGLMVDARYQYSLMSIREPLNVPPGFGYGGNQLNNMFSLRLIYLF